MTALINFEHSANELLALLPGIWPYGIWYGDIGPGRPYNTARASETSKCPNFGNPSMIFLPSVSYLAKHCSQAVIAQCPLQIRRLTLRNTILLSKHDPSLPNQRPHSPPHPLPNPGHPPPRRTLFSHHSSTDPFV